MSSQPHIIPFDTLKYAKRLQSANVPPEQAEMQAEALQETLGQAFQAAEVATRADVEMLSARIDKLDTDTKSGFTLVQKDIAALHAKIEAQGQTFAAKIEAESNKVITRIGGAVVAVLVALEVINRFWPKV